MYTSRCYQCKVYDIFKERGKLTPRLSGPFKITKEREEELKAKKISNFFSDPFESQGEIHFKGVGLSHPKILNLGCD
jgi:hypothetical protein